MKIKNKVVEGKKYKLKIKNRIASGGNGTISNVEVLTPKCDVECVIKVLSLEKWKGLKKEKRYQRFYKEISKVIEIQDDIDGIMNIVDFDCPEKFKDSHLVWYMMHKATSFQAYSKQANLCLKDKLNYMLELGEILKELHCKKYSHRDVKPENLLILNGDLMLSDFGLIWEECDEHITGKNEKLGPFYIRPPEFETIDLRITDYTPSDVYLYAKVIWMVLKDDSFGFRGMYNRKREDLYLNPLENNVETFEPIHKLLERATLDNMKERINIFECIGLVNEQLKILEKEGRSVGAYYRYCEINKEIENHIEPQERIFKDIETIINILKKILPYSTFKVSNTNDLMKFKSISLGSDEYSLILQSVGSEITSKQYLCYPKYIKSISEKCEYELHLSSGVNHNISSDFITYRDSMNDSWGLECDKVFINEELILLIKLSGEYKIKE